jgi:hypothetical protein
VNDLRRYIESNIISDSAHLAEISQTLDEMEGSIASVGRDQLLIGYLAKLLLLVMGEFPDHTHLRAVGQPEHFTLSRVRTLSYTRAAEQQVDLIVSTYLESKDANTLDDSEKQRLWATYRRCMHRRQWVTFVREFRSRHPDEYLRLFG